MASVNGHPPMRQTGDLDAEDYDPIDHLNTIFSHSSTLTAAPDVSAALQSHQYDLDVSIDKLVEQQTASNAASIQRLREAQSELTDLFRRIDGVRQRAMETEQSITTMTADIKRLDKTKRNLTLSMTALKRLQMLTTAYEQLRSLGKSRQYRECGQLLGAVVQLMAHFKSYRSIDQIAALGRKVSDTQRELLEQVCEDFEMAWERHEVAQKKATLHEACTVIDALGDGARSRLTMWYCNVTLKEYRQIFRSNEEAGSLDNISRRYAWYNRMQKTYDMEHAQIFPPHWKVNESLANSFCENTKDDFKSILQRSARRPDGQTLDVNLLLSCLQETLDFEQSLEKRFAADPRRSMDTMSVSSIGGGDESAIKHSFASAISSSFEPYLSLWVEAQDRHLASMIPKYRSQPIRQADEEFNAQAVMPSSTELFQFYRLTFAQCAKLSTGNRLLELSSTFSKFLDQYSQQVLFYALTAPSNSPQGPSIEDIIVILNTADYCATTSSQLEEKIKTRIDSDLSSSVDLTSQSDAFLGVAGACIRALVRKVEIDCEPGWREMRNIPWAKLDNVGDQSSYVGVLVGAIKNRSAQILPLLSKQQYARAFCDNLVEAFTATHLHSIAACRPISEVGAEQMLLDSYVLKKTLTELPSSTPQPPQSSSSTFTGGAQYAKRVAATTARTDSLLKTLQVRPSPPEALVQAYLLHVADRSEQNFRKLLDLKGLTARRDTAPLIELFNAHKSAPHHAQLPSAGTLLTYLPIGSNSSAAGPVGAASTSAAAAASANPAIAAASSFGSNMVSAATGSFGSALLNMTKDSPVGRVASPNSPAGLHGHSQSMSFGSSAEMSGHADGPTVNAGSAGGLSAAGVSENLRSIGRFFKRDLGASTPVSASNTGGGGSGLASAFGRFGGGG